MSNSHCTSLCGWRASRNGTSMFASGASHTVWAVCNRRSAFQKHCRDSHPVETDLRFGCRTAVRGFVMRIGLSMPLPAYTIDPAFMGRTAERLGFESIWYAEHPAVPVDSASPFPATGGAIPGTYSHFTDPYIALARASAVTTTLKLATGITLVPQRNPLLLAKEIAGLDHHSGGRFILGVGTGWLKEEVEIFGGNFG